MQKALVTIALVAAAAAASAGEVRRPRGSRAVRDSYIVVLKASAADTSRWPARSGLSVSQVAGDMAARHAGRLAHFYEHALRGFSMRMTEAAAQVLADDPRVDYVEQDSEMALMVIQSSAPWGLDRSDQRELPLSGTYDDQGGGAGVNAYVIDTGIRKTHVEFGGRARHGYSAINDGRGSDDCHGHGTHVAGTVGGSTAGVAKAATLWAVRVMDCTGSGPLSGTLAAIDWVTANHVKPAVANMSLGGPASQSLDDAIRRSIAAGVTYVFAAGNYNDDACLLSPARIPEGLTVGATGSADDRAVFSNWGPCVDLFAPGVAVSSSYYTSDVAMGSLSGTSMSAPHVAGVAALYLQANPSASPAAVTAALVDNATQGKVLSPGTGSPNRLLYSIVTPGADGPPCVDCQHYTGTLGGSRGRQKPLFGRAYFSGIPGTHRAWLRGPTGTNFNLSLRYFDGASWALVASSGGDGSTEEVAYYGPPGYYQWNIRSAAGAGTYDLWTIKPY